MKKLLIYLLTLAILVSSLTSCIKVDPELLEKYQSKEVEIPEYPTEDDEDSPVAPNMQGGSSEESGFIDRQQETVYSTESELTDAQKEIFKSVPDAVGWIEVPGTDINEVVVQSNDNLYYLRRTYMGEASFEGCFFLDHLSSVDPMTKNMTIYGHNMDDNKNGIKFAQLLRFDLDYVTEYNIIKYHTLERTYTYRIFAAFYSDLEFLYHRSTMSNTDFTKQIAEIMLRSEFETNLSILPGDRTITLSTCTYKYGDREDQRFVVVGRLLRGNESFDDSIKVVRNNNIKPPSFVGQ